MAKSNVVIKAAKKTAEKEPDNEQTRYWEAINKPPQTVIVQAFLTVYLNITLILWGMLVFDVATLKFGFIKWLLKIDQVEPTDPLILIMLALIGGAIGGILFGMNKLYKYSIKGTFDIRFVGDYVFRQVGSAALGAIIFALVASGLMTVGVPAIGDQTTEQAAESAAAEAAPTGTVVPEEGGDDGGSGVAPTGTPESNSDENGTNGADKDGDDKDKSPFSRASGYYVFGLGFLAGFGSYQVTKKLDQIIKVIFGQLTSQDIEDKT